MMFRPAQVLKRLLRAGRGVLRIFHMLSISYERIEHVKLCKISPILTVRFFYVGQSLDFELFPNMTKISKMAVK